MKKDRSTILLIFLYLQLVINVFGIIVSILLKNVPPKFAIVSYPVDFVVYIGLLICIVAVWKWKKWGLYGMLILYIIKLIENISFGDASGNIMPIVWTIFILYFLYTQKKLFR